MKSYKKDQRGITHNLMLAGIAVLVLGAIGFAGFRVYKSKNDISAKAYNWTVVNGVCTPGANSVCYSVKLCTSRVSSSRWLVRHTITSGYGVPIIRNSSGSSTQSLYNNPTYVSYEPYFYSQKIKYC